MTAHRYRAYGVTIRSDIEIPELPLDASDRSADVRVMVADVPSELEAVTRAGATYQAFAGQLLLRVPEVANYLVTAGAEIAVEPAGGSDHDIRVYLLGSCFGAMLHQRGLLVLHASGIGGPEGAAVFAGSTGAGKSSLLGELLRRGHRMIVDDVCAIDVDCVRPTVLPSYPRTRLWDDAADRLRLDTSTMHRTRSFMSKFERQVPHQFWSEPAALRRIYILSDDGTDDISVTRMGPLQAFPLVEANVYRKMFVDGFGLRQRNLGRITTIVREVGVVHVRRPRGVDSVAAIADAVETDLNSDGD